VRVKERVVLLVVYPEVAHPVRDRVARVRHEHVELLEGGVVAADAA